MHLVFSLYLKVCYVFQPLFLQCYIVKKDIHQITLLLFIISVCTLLTKTSSCCLSVHSFLLRI
jgi:hypothetical protein